MRFIVLLISLILPSTTLAAEVCLSADERVGATYGTAEFVGEPWVHTWTDGNQSAASGHQIVIRVEDATFVYGVESSADMNGGWFDHLDSLTRRLGDGPYTAARLRDGSVRMYGSNCRWWSIRGNLPSNPVPVKGHEPITEPGPLACVAEQGIIEYIVLELERGHNENPLGEKSLFASYGASRYATGFDTWGTQIQVWINSPSAVDGMCGSSR